MQRLHGRQCCPFASALPPHSAPLRLWRGPAKVPGLCMCPSAGAADNTPPRPSQQRLTAHATGIASVQLSDPASWWGEVQGAHNPTGLGTFTLVGAFTPTVWFLLALALSAITNGNAWERRDAGNQPLPAAAAASLAQVLVRLLLPCQLLLLAVQPAAWVASGTFPVPWDLLAAGMVWAAACVAIGMTGGLLAAQALTSLWHLPRSLERYLRHMRSTAAPIPPGLRRPLWHVCRGLLDSVLVTLASWTLALVEGLGSHRVLSMGGGSSSEDTMASAVAAALGAPAAAPSLKRAPPEPPAWLPAALMAMGAACAAWLGSTALLHTLPAYIAKAPVSASSSLPPLIHSLIGEPVLSQALSDALSVPCAHMPAWVAWLPGVEAAISEAASEWAASGASSLGTVAVDAMAQALGHGWMVAVLLGQALAIWGYLVPLLVRFQRFPAGNGAIPRLWPRFGGLQTSGRRGTAPGAGVGGRSMDVVDGRVWVQVGDNQEVALSSSQLSQLVPFNTLLPGQVRLSGGARRVDYGSGGGLPLMDAGPLQSRDEEPVVQAEVRDYPEPSDSPGGPGGGEDGPLSSHGGALEDEDTQGSHGTLQRAVERWQWRARRAWHSLASNPPLLSILLGLTGSFVYCTLQHSIAPLASMSFTASNLIVVPPWEWSAVQRLAASCTACITWAAAASSAVMCLHAVIACVVKRGQPEPGSGARLSPLEKLERAQSMWSGLENSSVTGSNSVMAAAKRLLLPASYIEAFTLASAVATVLLSVPATVIVDRAMHAALACITGKIMSLADMSNVLTLGTGLAWVPMQHATLGAGAAVTAILAVSVVAGQHVDTEEQSRQTRGTCMANFVALSLLRVGLLGAILRSLPSLVI